MFKNPESRQEKNMSCNSAAAFHVASFHEELSYSILNKNLGPPQLREYRKDEILFSALWDVWKIFCEISCNHFQLNTFCVWKDENWHFAVFWPFV